MPRIPTDYNFSDIKNSYFAYRKPKGIGHAQYTAFIKDVNKALVQHVLDGNILKFPAGLGSVLIERYKPMYRVHMIDGKPVIRNNLVDFKATNDLRKSIEPEWGHEEWKKVPLTERPFVMHTNEHTQGYSYRITWRRKECTFANAKVYKFVPNELTFKEGLVKILKSDDINKPSYYDKQQIHFGGDNSRESEEGLTTNRRYKH